MFLFILTAIVSGDVVRFNTVNTQKSIQLMMGGAPQTFEKDVYGRLTWMDNPSTSEITLIIGDESFDLRTSRTGAGYNGCNYNFDLYSDSEMYQNSGMECTKVFEKAPGAIELINDVGKSVYPAFDLGWGFSSDSVMGWLGADMIAVYTSENPYLAAIGAKEGTELEVGYFDQSDYKSCGKVKVGEEFIKKLSECTGVEEAVGVHCKVATGWDKKHNCGGGYWELKPWGCCSQMCCPAEADTQEAVGGHPLNPYEMKGEVELAENMYGNPHPYRSCCYIKYRFDVVPGISWGDASTYWQKTWDNQGCNNKVSSCAALSDGAESSMVAEASTLKSFSTEDWAVYGFAVIGIGALAMQAYKMVKAKNSEAMPIYQEV